MQVMQDYNGLYLFLVSMIDLQTNRLCRNIIMFFSAVELGTIGGEI